MLLNALQLVQWCTCSFDPGEMGIIFVLGSCAGSFCLGSGVCWFFLFEVFGFLSGEVDSNIWLAISVGFAKGLETNPLVSTFLSLSIAADLALEEESSCCRMDEIGLSSDKVRARVSFIKSRQVMMLCHRILG